MIVCSPNPINKSQDSSYMGTKKTKNKGTTSIYFAKTVYIRKHGDKNMPIFFGNVCLLS
jgi:hypothetical protein